VQSVLNDLDNAPISDKDRTLYAFIRKMVRESTSIGQEDVDVARTAGWSDEALYDAITVCSLFQFYNNWIDATGVGDLPVLGYEMSGHRLATQGYASEPASESRSGAKRSNGLKGPRRPATSERPIALKPSRKSKASKKSHTSSASIALKRSKRSTAATAATAAKASRKSKRPMAARTSQGSRRG
jgi:hypothetical protein